MNQAGGRSPGGRGLVLGSTFLWKGGDLGHGCRGAVKNHALAVLLKGERRMKENRTRLRRWLLNGVLLALLVAAPVVFAVTPTEAPAGYDNQTNGFESQTAMDADRAVFEETEQLSDGLGPIYNAQSCRECHQNPVTGATSQVSELRVGFFNGHTFTPPVGGSSL